jgi:hypothetical protein
MNVGEVKEYNLKIGEKEYTFRLDFKALIKFNERYKGYKIVPVLKDGKPKLDQTGKPVTLELGAMDIFNDFINGKDQYGGLVKILSCACIDKDLTEEELLNKLSFDFPTMKVLDAITMHMIQGSLALDKKKEESTEKNTEKN